MKAFYYPLLLKRLKNRSTFYFGMCLLLARITSFNSFAQSGALDLGMPAYSSLAWDHISSVHTTDQVDASIGLTKDARIYTWGGNQGYTSNANIAANNYNMYQLAPYFVKSPVGETPIKVRVAASSANNPGGTYSGFPYPTYFCLTASGKIYAWGINNGIAGNDLATFPVVTSSPAINDTTKAKRSPILMTNIGESSFVDMEFSKTLGYGIVIGSSGAAYHIGVSNIYGTFEPTFAAIPLPSGVGSGFKYTNVWVSDFNTKPLIYLKGNDGNIYLTGAMSSNYTSGILALYPRTTAPTLTASESNGSVRLINPRLVPFPAGENIIDINIRSKELFDNTYAISASGKAYVAGAWRFTFARGGGTPGMDYRQYVVVPLAATPPTGQLDAYLYNSGDIDSVYMLKQFQQIAMPSGVTSILSILGGRDEATQNWATLMIGNNNKVYWSGSGFATQGITDLTIGNFLQLTSSGAPASVPDQCLTVQTARSNSYYSWLYEAINFQGAVKLFRPHSQQQLGIISKSGRGYFVGVMSPNTAPGKVLTGGGVNVYKSIYPVPIVNEQLLSCNTSPGTGGPLGEPVSTPGVGAIDCSKTKLYPAPVQGTPSELSLLVTINVTTVGDFSPITISGSGMSLVSGFDKVTATTTGVQTFHIPIKYNGSTLTNNFQFTIGSAGSCSADLTNKPSNEITKVWSLNNCTAITPGVLSK